MFYHTLPDDYMSSLTPEQRAIEEQWVKVQAFIESFLALYPDANYGFAHIALSDYNLEDDVLDGLMAQEVEPTEENAATMTFLRVLRAIPEEKRCPRDYE